MHIHDYSVARLLNKTFGKGQLLTYFIDDAIMLTYVLYYKQNKWSTLSSAVRIVEFSLLENSYHVCRLCGWSSTKNLLSSWSSSHVQLLPILYMGTFNMSDKILYMLIFVVDNVVYMDSVNNSNKAWHALIQCKCSVQPQ